MEKEEAFDSIIGEAIDKEDIITGVNATPKESESFPKPLSEQNNSKVPDDGREDM